jgi:hypothetical protein
MIRHSRISVLVKTKSLNKSVNSIFEKNEEGNYSLDALMYQDILRYYLVENKENNPFRLRQLQQWIVRHNLEILNYYSGSKSHASMNNKIHGKEERINNKFENLISLGLIRLDETNNNEQQKSASLYVQSKSLYIYTKAGIILALIMKSMNLEKNINFEKKRDQISSLNIELEKNNTRIYDLIDSTLPINDDYPSSNIFYKSLYKKIKNAGVFDKVVLYIADLCESHRFIESVRDLLENVYGFTFKDKSDRKKFLDLWYENLEEQEPEVKDIFLYQMKLSVEKRFEYSVSHFSREYERQRFKHRADHQKIVLEGRCESCKQPTVVIWSYINYLKIFANVEDDDPIRIDCKTCNTKNSGIIPNF